MSDHVARSVRGRPAGRGAGRWLQDEAWLALAAPALIFLGHALYGAMLPGTALALTLAAAALLGVILMRRRLRNELSRLDGVALPAALFAAVIIVGLLSLTPWAPGGPHPVWSYLGLSPGAATIDKSQTLLEIVKLLGLACFFVVGSATGASDARARLAVNLLLVLGAIFGTWAFLAFVTGVFGPGSVRRLEASFLSANTAGTLFACLFVLTLGPVASTLRTRPHRLSEILPYGLAGLLLIVCLFMTASRGAFMAAAVGLGTFGLLQAFSGRMKWSRTLLSGGLAVVVLCVLLGVTGDMMIARLFNVPADVASRSYIAQVHWQTFLASPLTGYGLGTFDLINRMQLDASNFEKIWTIRAVHNIYLSWLEQAGLLGAVPMFACIGAIIVSTARHALRRFRMTSLLFALLAADAVFLAHGVTDFALEMYSMAAMWAWMLGLQFSLSQGSSSR